VRRLALWLVWIGSARAYPTLAPRPIANAIAGPADVHVGAAYMNPAALGPLHGVHFWMDGGPRFQLGSIQQPKGTTPINNTSLDAFIGATWDVGTDSFTLAVSTIVPFADLASFGDSAARYQSIDQAWVSYQQSLGVSGKLSSRLYVGAGFNMTENWMRWRFARDAALYGGSPGVNDPNHLCGATPCGFENPLARETVRLRGFGMGYGFSVGILGRATDRLWLAASYISHFFTGGGGDEVILIDESGTRIDGPGVVCTNKSGAAVPCTGNSRTAVYLPDILQAAARAELTSKLDIEATLRWVHWGERSQLDWTAQGGNLSQVRPDLAPPAQNRRDLGLQDTFGAELSLRMKVGDKLRLMPSIFFETSSVDGSAVSAAALDAPKLDLALVAEWRPVKHLVLGAHFGFTSFLMRDVDSRHDPNDTVQCVDAHYSLSAAPANDPNHPWCGKVTDGDGLPSASGRYTLFTVHLGAALGLDY
jgi:long-subunit fatty acid transport protein